GEPGQEGIEVRFPPRGRRAAASWPSLTVNQTWLTKGFVRASYSRAQITQFYADALKGKFPEQQRRAIEEDIFAAQREGRIR
ncbi:hypothetical protein, partial [Methylocella sp.]|uniref:hypothetical protein n=1 Tax=Methylocella sp. TaxID=1978226 RepID=UPI0035B062D2